LIEVEHLGSAVDAYHQRGHPSIEGMVLRVPFTWLPGVMCVYYGLQKGVDAMDSEVDIERRIEQWNARWMVVAGRVVCTRCLESQALTDCEKEFSHAIECNAELGDNTPWVALHDILDRARG
jgi:hypothetical protein